MSSVIDGDCSTAEQQGPEVVGATDKVVKGSAVSSATSVSGHGDHHVNLINLAPPPLAAAADYPYILMSSPSSQTGSSRSITPTTSESSVSGSSWIHSWHSWV